MSTNYYILRNYCEHCDIGEPLHIGLSASGWVFSLHVHEDENINSLDDWIPLLKGNVIIDEYNRKKSYDEMIDIITKREPIIQLSWKKDGYASLEDFLSMNEAILDEKIGLLRHNNRRLKRPGSGTWDEMIGDFS